MTVIDVAIVFATLASAWILVMHRNTLVKSNATLGSLMVAAGLLMVGLFYLTDFFVMFGLPFLIPKPAAWALMEDLHLNYSWIVMLLGTGCILGGFVLTNRPLFSLIDRLKESQASVGRELAERKRAEEQAERRRRQAEVLAGLGQSINASLDFNVVLQRVVEGAKELCGSDIGYIMLRDHQSAVMVPRYRVGTRYEGYDTLRVEPGKGMGGEVLRTGRPFRTDNYAEDPRISKDYLEATRVEGIIAQMGVPIRNGDRTDGVLFMANRSPRRFTDRDEAILLQLADQAAIAIQNARLYQDTQARRRAAEALLEITQALGSTLELKHVLKIIAQRTAQTVGAERCSIHLHQRTHLVPVMSQFADGHADPDLWGKFKATKPYPLAEVPAHVEAIQTKRPVAIEDVTGTTMIPAYWVDTYGVRAILVVPLVHQDEVIGVLNLDQTKGPHAWQEDQIDLTMTIASQAALAVENARLFKETERRRQQAECLADVGRLICESLDPDEVAQRMVDWVRDLFVGNIAALYQLDEDTGGLVAVAVSGTTLSNFEWNSFVARGTGTSGLALRRRHPVATPDVLADPSVEFTPEAQTHLRQTSCRAVLAAPLLVKAEAIGALLVGDGVGRVFNDEEIRLAQAFADQAALALEKAQLYKESEHRRRGLATLVAVSRRVTRGLERRAVLHAIAEAAAQLFEGEAGFRLLEGEFLVRAAATRRAHDRMAQERIPIGGSLAGHVAATGQPVVTSDAGADPRTPPELRSAIGQVTGAQMTVPVGVGSQVLGTLSVFRERGYRFRQDTLALAMSLAGHAGAALQNARLFEQTEAGRRAADGLLSVAQTLGSTLDLTQVLKIITQRTAQAVGAERCSLNLWQEGHLVPVMSQFADGHADPDLWAKFKAMGPYRVDEVPAHAEAIRTKQPVAIDDVTRATMIPAYWVETFGIRSILLVPLIHQDEVVGILNLDQIREAGAWSQGQIDLAMTIANQATLALVNARLYQETEHRQQRLATLVEVSQRLTRGLELPPVLSAIADAAARLFDGEAGFRLVDGEHLVRTAATPGARAAMPRERLRIGESVSGQVAATGEPIVTLDVSIDPRVIPEHRARIRAEQTGALVCVPLRVDSRILGTLNIYRERGYQFDQDALKLAMTLADQAAIAIHNARLYEEIRRTRDFLHSIAENSADVIGTTDIHGRITYFSSAAEEIFGYRPEEMLGRAVADFYRSGQEEAREVMTRLRAEGRIRNYETALLAKDGRWVETDSSFSLLRDPSGAIVGTVGVVRDATERKRADSALRDSEERFRNLIEGSIQGVLIHRDFKPLFVNQAFAEMFGYETRDDVLRLDTVLELFAPHERSRVTEYKNARLRGAYAPTRFEFQGIRKDGSLVWLENVARVVTWDGKPAVQATLFDITEHKRLEEELIRSERVWAVGEMAAGVAHNFNNLLAVILGRAQFLLLQLQEGTVQLGEIRRNLAVIERATLSGAQTVHRLLAFTRDSAGSGQAMPVNVEELLTHTVELAQHRWKDEAEARGCHIQVLLQPDHVPPVAGNGAELQEVLLSLVLNAVDAMPQGGTLTLSSWAQDGRVCMAVKDTGTGIPEEVRARIFEPFFTTKGPQSTGLGLSVCYGIIRRHEGEIVVDSQPGHGTTFTIKLPAQGLPPAGAEHRAMPREDRLRILIIEDEAEVRAMFRDIAQAGGHEVWEAASGPEGLELLERQSVDLLCTDLGMPGMTGWQVAEHVKARWPELNVALVTGWGAWVEPEELKAYGVDLLITKPFQVKPLLQALSDFQPLRHSRSAS